MFIQNLLLSLLALGTTAALPSTHSKRWDPPSPALSLNRYEQEVFDVSMQINDWSWEPSTGWIEADDDNVSCHRQVKLIISRDTPALDSLPGTSLAFCTATKAMTFRMQSERFEICKFRMVPRLSDVALACSIPVLPPTGRLGMVTTRKRPTFPIQTT